MKRTKRITKLTVETKRVFIFKSLDAVQLGWCDDCAAEAQMATVAAAAREAGLSELVIYQLLDNGVLHFTEDPEERVLVCLNSLLK